MCLGQRMMLFRVNEKMAASEFVWAFLSSDDGSIRVAGGSLRRAPVRKTRRNDGEDPCDQSHDTAANPIDHRLEACAVAGLRVPDDQAFVPYFAGAQLTGGGVFVRTRVSSAAAFSAIRAAVRQVDSGLPLQDMRTLDDQLDKSLVNERLLATLASAFAGLAVLLTVVGLYGVMSFVVTRRTREIGIRLALGASKGSALWLILRETATMVAAGLTIALPAVWALGRLIESQLFEVRAMDGATIAAAVALVAVVALAASAFPARRATSISPIEALRTE